MKQAKIFKNNTFFCETDKLGMPEEDLNKWLAKHISKNTFGLPERPELMLDEATEEMTPTGNTLPAEYEIVIEDITAQLEQEKINAEALAYLASTDFKVLRHIRQKALGEELSLSEQEYLILEKQRSDAAKRIIR